MQYEQQPQQPLQYPTPRRVEQPAPAPQPAPDALGASIAEERAEERETHVATIDFAGDTFKIHRKPPTLLLAELARTNSGDPEAMGVLAEFFEVTLGKDEYNRFKRAVYSYDGPEAEDEILSGLMAGVIERTLGRPTE